ncbi:hypothetical protein ZIOFF_051570 [Zingiber officinale]|uniref:tryptophan synthase n=1 Tax=Zingiber officinale TaxID=94328 RepID=A0A8J5FRH1_ZINOF|nr:hypothetical protein ZIOFF_051570 [Zingiber officinale]
MVVASKASLSLLPLRSSSGISFSCRPSSTSISWGRSCTPMASLSVASAPAISEIFSRLKEKNKVAFIPFITAGDPDLSTTSKALKVLDSSGSDLIELGIPYSDPLADGPVIQAAATRALAKGTNFDGVISMLREVVPELSCPIALFTYYNPILKRGIDKFMSIIKDVGVRGLVVPDVPLEETENLRKEAVRHKIELVSLHDIFILTLSTNFVHMTLFIIINLPEFFVVVLIKKNFVGKKVRVCYHYLWLDKREYSPKLKIKKEKRLYNHNTRVLFHIQ